ncbi:hypothetical protein EYF80_039173 [Liparis tanakae]|uniref:Uncharacterized protein n=1 Tax=Liparis tanakae TaxID=230148 RepID=A0A4Z2GB56_9TELE|nr:hypothetical protein EYF80_039173 [Liparis tanakae]
MNYNRPLKSDPHGPPSQPGACDQPRGLEKKTEHGTEHSVSLPTRRCRGRGVATWSGTPPSGAVTAKSHKMSFSATSGPPPPDRGWTGGDHHIDGSPSVPGPSLAVRFRPTGTFTHRYYVIHSFQRTEIRMSTLFCTRSTNTWSDTPDDALLCCPPHEVHFPCTAHLEPTNR